MAKSKNDSTGETSERPSAKHDNLFKYAFSKPEHAAGEFRTLLPADVNAAIDWSTLELTSATAVDEELKELRSDLVFHVELNDEPALLYLLIEHQSSNDPLMAFRLLRYVVRVWDQWLKGQEERPKALPPVIPFVMYHGKSSWSAPTRLEDIITLDSGLLPSLGEYLPRLTYVLDDLSSRTQEEIQARKELTDFGRLCQAMLQFLEVNPMPLLEAWVDTVLAVGMAPEGLPDIQALSYYMGARSDEAYRAEVLRFMQENLGERGEQVVRTMADAWREEGVEQGEEKGRKALRRAIFAGIEARGLDINDASRRNVRDCTEVEVLEGWLRRVFTAETAEDIFKDEPS